eukprot:4406352-Amphidinium_carterae.1
MGNDALTAETYRTTKPLLSTPVSFTWIFLWPVVRDVGGLTCYIFCRLGALVSWCHTAFLSGKSLKSWATMFLGAQDANVALEVKATGTLPSTRRMWCHFFKGVPYNLCGSKLHAPKRANGDNASAGTMPYNPSISHNAQRHKLQTQSLAL